MKKILIIITIISCINCKAQIVYNLGTPAEQIIGDNTYVMDINNQYAKVVGTWKWEEGNKSFEITLQKFTKYSYPSTDTTYGDKIFGKYIYKENGVVISETTTFKTFPDFALLLTYRTPDEYSIIISDKLSLRSKRGAFKFLTDTTATFKLREIGGALLNQPNTGDEFSLPMDIVLTKQ